MPDETPVDTTAATLTDDTAAPDPAPADAPDPARADADPKKASAAAYEARKANEKATALELELSGYKRREEEARQAKLTEQERLKEETESLRAENSRLKSERAISKIRAEFKLPEAFVLVGSDEDALRAHAAELAALLPKPRAGSATDPARDAVGAKARIYTRAELAGDVELARSAEVLLAMREGRIRN
jgi:hypothetical protein